MFSLFTLTSLWSAALLFAVQPMVAKMLLPKVGGVPAVWTTCQLFFQGVLLAGYAYAHWIARRPSRARVHGFVALLGTVLAPISLVSQQTGTDYGPAWVLYTLVLTQLSHTFALAASSPLLQRWYATLAPARSPYPLYAASNAGSLFALLGYPFLIEPLFTIEQQVLAFRVGYLVQAVAILCCVLLVHRATSSTRIERQPTTAERTPLNAAFFRWVLFAFVPASLLLGATTYASTDLAPVPLLWVVPLSLYLLTYVIAFANEARAASERLKRVFVLLTAMLFFLVLPEGPASMPLVAAHFAYLFIGALIFHRELVLSRPSPDQLTAFYLAIGLGGMLAGVTHALVAPVLFSRVLEYPLTMALACALVPFSQKLSEEERQQKLALSLGLAPEQVVTRAASSPWPTRLDVLVPVAIGILGIALETLALTRTTRLIFGLGTLVILAGLLSLSRPRRFAYSLVMLLIAVTQFESHVLARGRSFLGTLRVEEFDGYRVLFHGTTIHGRQHLDPKRRREPNTYYTSESPIGRLFALRAARLRNARIGVVGLGTGTLATYAQAEQRVRFYELDPLVETFARRYFTYLDDCRANVEVVLGDARLALAREPAQRMDLLIVDAFSSDAIPVHLLTREALSIYMRALSAEGLLVVHATNRYLRIDDVLASLAHDARLHALVARDRDARNERVSSTWVVIAKRERDLADLAQSGVFRPAKLPERMPVWTDGSSSILSALRSSAK